MVDVKTGQCDFCKLMAATCVSYVEQLRGVQDKLHSKGDLNLFFEVEFGPVSPSYLLS